MKKIILSVSFSIYLFNSLFAQDWAALGAAVGKGDAKTAYLMFTYEAPCLDGSGPTTPRGADISARIYEENPFNAYTHGEAAVTCRYVYSGYGEAFINFKEQYIAWCMNGGPYPVPYLPPSYSDLYYRSMAAAFQIELAKYGY